MVKSLLKFKQKAVSVRHLLTATRRVSLRWKSLKCCCSGKKHTYVAKRNKPVCGCISPAFIQNAKRNHYCALLQAGRNPGKYRETKLCMGKYHSRDIHEWEGGYCKFHPLKKM